MRIAITGSSGLVGSALTPALEAAGHKLVPIRHGAASEPTAQWDPEAGWLQPAILEGADAVVHLAGTSIGNGRWTATQKQSIWASRVLGARLLVDRIRSMTDRPQVLITSSAVGFYGDRGDERLTEQSPRGEGFLSHVCTDWEAEAFKAEELGVRVVAVRSGVLLRSLLPVVLRPFQFGLGGPLGSGRQYFAWAALDDVVGIYQHLLQADDISGPVNAVGPTEASNREFTRELAGALHRPAILPLPSFALNLIMGADKARETALVSQRVVPERLLKSGYEFTHPAIGSAIRAALSD